VLRDVTVLIEGLLFCHIEAPDPQYAYAAPEPISIDLCEPDETHPLRASVPSAAFFARLFIHEWNALVHVAAYSARLLQP
jgi:hypothetical protein